jgi:hypothetical protein
MFIEVNEIILEQMTRRGRRERRKIRHKKNAENL